MLYFKKIGVLFFCLFASYSLLFSQEKFSLSKIAANAELSHSAVLSICQDSNGFMWFGTYDGLNFYDSKNIKSFRSNIRYKNSITSNIVESFAPSNLSNFWVVSPLGIDKFSTIEQKVLESYKVFHSNPHLYANSKGTTWLIVSDSVYFYQKDKFSFCQEISEDINYENSFTDSQGVLWLIDKKSPSIVQLQMNNKGQLKKRRGKFHKEQIIYAFYQNETLSFIDKKYDLYIYDIRKNDQIYIRNVKDLIKKNGVITGILPFYQDVLISFLQNGLVSLQGEQQYQAKIINNKIRIFSLYQDIQQKIVWIGTDGEGVFQYKKDTSLAKSVYTSSLSPELTRPIRSFFRDSLDNLWIGTKGDGLLRIANYKSFAPSSSIFSYTTHEKKEITAYKRSLLEFHVYCFKESPSKTGFWMGSNLKPGFFFYNYSLDRIVTPQTSIDKQMPENIHGIFEENDSILWLASAGHSLCKAKIKKNKNRSISIENIISYHFFYKKKRITDIYAMLSENDTTLWLGSRGMGLVKFNTRTNDYFVFSLEEEFGSAANDILSLYKENSLIYVGSTAGFFRLNFNKKNSFIAKRLDENNELLNNMIHGILKDHKGFLWLSTNKGLVKYNPQNGSFHTYYHSGGVNIGEFCDDAYFYSKDSTLFFGGVNGFVSLKKEALSSDDYDPTISIQNLKINDKEEVFNHYFSKESGKLEIKGTSVNLELSYIAPDYTQENVIEYATKLIGYDSAYHYFSAENRAKYSNLSPGSYQLSIKYKNGIHNSKRNEFILPIEIIPPFYLSSYAYLFYFLFSGVLLFFLLRFFLTYYKRGKLLAKLERHELKSRATNNAENKRELFTSLSVLCKELFSLKKSIPADSIAEFEQVYHALYAISNAFDKDFCIEKREKTESVDVVEQLQDPLTKHLLILSNNQDLSTFLQKETSSTYTSICVSTINEALQQLKQHSFDLFIVDTIMYNQREKELFTLLYSHKSIFARMVIIPVISIDGLDDHKDLITKIADLYIILPYDLNFIAAIIQRAYRQKEKMRSVVIYGVNTLNDELHISSDGQVDFLTQVVTILEKNLSDENLSVSYLADELAMSPRNFYRKFKDVCNYSPSDFVKQYKLERAASLLITTDSTIQDIIHQIGISSKSYFYKEFSKKYNLTPKEYREEYQKSTKIVDK